MIPPPGSRFVLRVRSRFEAAHHLTSYRGRAETPHGHSWAVEAELRTAGLDAEGMAYDFVAVKRALDDLVRPLDHADLNRIPPFDRVSPTTEHLAAWLLEALRARLPGAPVAAVTVWEGPDCAASCLAGEVAG
ncbi:MAG: 6-pyruvoyl tetrahydropterin synthase family protein [Thermoanaerobaculia bacterium]|nr:6-pyruvoyl tetrahydropterin synthase family protein [Thermoanaerobaculia bacterium]MCZ7651879.1 6-carboxytetrahydropterin synthase [Thermoanaerobaculia bacterium]